MKKITGIVVLLAALAIAALVFTGLAANATDPGVNRVTLYRQDRNRDVFVRDGDVYTSEWKAGKDITTVYPLATDMGEVAINGRHHQDVFNEFWKSYEGWESSKICYRIEFGTFDGKSFDVMIMKPGDELLYSDYLENYIYDDIRVPKNTWYSHLTPDDTGDLTLSSVKFTAGKKVDLINTPIRVTACIYNGEEDFDRNGRYIGDVSSSLTVVRKASSLSITVTKDGKNQADLRDKDYKTSVAYVSNDKVTVKSETPMAGIYVIWDAPVRPWKLAFNGDEIECGSEGFIHDYVEVGGATECTLTISGWTKISEIYAYSEGELPDDVEVWEKPLEKADMLVFSTHADDEVLFFGGAATLYNALGYKVQVVYMCNYWDAAKVREHEKLDGLWAMGLRNYPVNMEFGDYYSESLEEAKKTYDIDSIVTAVTKNIRRFKPQVIVTHDINGEYGHGGHMILCAALREAVEKTADASFRPESAELYGTYNVPKTYLHLYGENKLRLNLRETMDELSGRTPLDVEKDAYKKHVSQQWTWFYVDDEYKYSCADFGLYRTLVGNDTAGKNDMMENIVSYEEQKRIAEEEERQRLEEEERKKREEEERLRLEEEERLRKEEEKRKKAEEEERKRLEEEERKRLEEEEQKRLEEERRKREEEENAKATKEPAQESGPSDTTRKFIGVLMIFVAIVIIAVGLVPAAITIIKKIKTK